MKKKKPTAVTTPLRHVTNTPSKIKVIWSSIAIAAVSALTCGGASILLTILTVTCALNLGCNSDQDFLLSFGIIAYFVIMIASIVILHKSTRVASWRLFLAWLAGIALFFAGGWTWMKVDSIFTQREQRKQIERLKQDYDKVTSGNLKLNINVTQYYSDVEVILPIYVSVPVSPKSISKMFIISKSPELFDSTGKKCDSFDTEFHLAGLISNDKPYEISIDSDLNPGIPDTYYLQVRNSFSYLEENNCRDKKVLDQLSVKDFEVTKVPLDQLIPDQFK